MDFKLRTPDYTPVRTDPTAAGTLPQAQSVRAAWSWNQRLASSVVLFVLGFGLYNVKFYDFAATSTVDLVDYADMLFCSRDESEKLPGALSVDKRPDIASFGFDLGGSSCACQLQWDVKQYWQRVFYGLKYVAPHCITNFLGVIFFHRWQWVIIYNYVHEIVEELSLGVGLGWALVNRPIDVESRYDTLINDMLLCCFPFIFLAQYLLYVLNVPDPFASGLHYDWNSLKMVGLTAVQYYVLLWCNNMAGMFGGKTWAIGQLQCHIGYLFACTLQIGLFYVIHLMNAWEGKQTLKICVVLTLIWLPFVFRSVDNLDEQIIAILSFVLCAAAIFFYEQAYHRFDNNVLVVTALITIASFVVWWQFEHVLPPPDNMFYAHRKWCGIAARSKGLTDSCVHVK